MVQAMQFRKQNPNHTTSQLHIRGLGKAIRNRRLDPRQLEHNGKKAKPKCKRTEHVSSPGQIQVARQPSTTSSDIMVAARQVGNSQLKVTNASKLESITKRLRKLTRES
ncbi:hypothetical protein SADUNF_Sadunf16G0142500 [Salix dunnii]|uniref:Uncharacterized protein n=1 Tax=Salix dunnii TaxID=1413687 RepID=A0A835J8M0_9ROSI|nr:hypothetical protein SADUNF_Sadunf16G0142500 [Salix dunnii]